MCIKQQREGEGEGETVRVWLYVVGFMSIDASMRAHDMEDLNLKNKIKDLKSERGKAFHAAFSVMVQLVLYIREKRKHM